MSKKSVNITKENQYFFLRCKLRSWDKASSQTDVHLLPFFERCAWKYKF